MKSSPNELWTVVLYIQWYIAIIPALILLSAANLYTLLSTFLKFLP